ncbi:MAG TPA: translation factor GTPase family protein [Actinospica sp.]|nr:translation factor GTPase family protein [Actinospica sp.]
MRSLNLGILAHVDAGKTSLTERLLHATGVIGEIGSVDAGSTVTDSLELERRRGITIKAAVANFELDGVSVNLIDTPGHSDFIAEVERALGVLDGAVLVVSAVEGVQPQTRVLMRVLQRLRIPTLFFVNKVDRRGARIEALLADIAGLLTPHAVAMGTVVRAGTAQAVFEPFDVEGSAGVAFRARLLDRLTVLDEDLLAAYVADEGGVTGRRLRRALAAQSRRGRLHPVFFGSAITGAGVEALLHGIRNLLPLAADDADAPIAGSVFKMERGPAGEPVAYVRMYAGTLRVRDRIRFGAGDDARSAEGRVTSIGVFEGGAALARQQVAAGGIAKLRGLTGIRIGDEVRDARGGAAPLGRTEQQNADRVRRHHFSPPTLETVVEPRTARDRAGLHPALTLLAEQDPLIDLRQDDVRREISVSLYGEVQKEVIQSTLAEQFGVEVDFRPTTTICVERVAGIGTAEERIKQGENPFIAGIGLRVEPGGPGAGVRYGYEIELGSLPIAFHKAIEETVHATLREGLHGWQVVDARVTLVSSGYWPRQSAMHATFNKAMSSTAGDFRQLTSLVLMDALRRAGTIVQEPIQHFSAEVPADVFGTLLPVLTGLRAVPRESAVVGASYRVDGDIPAGRTHELEQLLMPLTRGEGVLETAFDRYQDVVGGEPPERARTDLNPLDRKEYLLRLSRRLSTC